MEIIEYKGEWYPAFQATGNAMRFALPFAKEICKGVGADVGCNRVEWAFTDASFLIDPAIDPKYDALNFPDEANELDYIVSSHLLEHLPDWVGALDYWHTRLKHGGSLFLYLPDTNTQLYWRPSSNRRHLHYMNPDIISKYFEDRVYQWQFVLVTEYDLNNSFYAIATKI